MGMLGLSPGGALLSCAPKDDGAFAGAPTGDEVAVTWPDGEVSVFGGVGVRRVITTPRGL